MTLVSSIMDSISTVMMGDTEDVASPCRCCCGYLKKGINMRAICSGNFPSTTVLDFEDDDEDDDDTDAAVRNLITLYPVCV